MLAPPFTPFEQLQHSLQDRGYAVLSPDSLSQLVKVHLGDLQNLKSYWNNLPRDPYLKDGGRYRFRRHGSYVINSGQVELAPHRAHWQSVDYNALHGGIERWFEPLEPTIQANQNWQQLMLGISYLFPDLPRWYVEAHPFRIDTSDGIGRPTPEGAHRDGVDYVVVILVDRVGVKGGETRIFEAQGSIGLRFTLQDSWTVLVLNDAKMIHETTPIQPIGSYGYRDTLVVTFRRNGFQEPPHRQDQ
ncbi:MAG: hypothetical protein FJY58_04930 [Betaproteobacteria bacterium]|nr:hypothetical protein [Betaproteobacteria bacterium]